MAVKGHVDGMSGAYVIGWAFAEPDLGNCEIKILNEDGEILARGRASRHRSDLIVLGMGRTSFAYRIPVITSPERQWLRVTADDEELPGSPFATGAGVFDSSCGVEGGNVVGWITERTTGFAPPLITVVNQNGAVVGEARSVMDNEGLDPLAAAARYHVELSDAVFGAGETCLSVRANAVEFAKRSCNLLLDGNLEVINGDGCGGWLVSPDQPRRELNIELYRDGELVNSAICDIAREDVRGTHPNCGKAGFWVALPSRPHDDLSVKTLSLRLKGSEVELFNGPYVIGNRPVAVAAAQRAARLAQQDLPGLGPAERAVIQIALSEYLANARMGNQFTAKRQGRAVLPSPGRPAPSRPAASRPAPSRPAPRRPRITVIIPVYKGVEVTRACIVSVLAHRGPDDRLVLVNDCSPDSDMAKTLEGFSHAPETFLFTNEKNLGFVKTVNRALGFATGGDVLLLNSDTVLYPGGLDEIHRVAYAHPEIGTVTALSNNATIFSYPHAALRRDRLSDIGWAELAEAALEVNAGVTVDVPTGHGFCMFIKAEVLSRIGHLSEEFGRGYGEENDLCQRAADLGYRHVAAAAVIVEHRESISFEGEKASLMAANLPRLGAMYPELTPLIMEFERTDGMRRARWALDRLRLSRAVAAGGSFALVIANCLDGGTVKARDDIERATDHYHPAVELSLCARADGFLELSCEAPILFATFAAAEIDELFAMLGSAEPTQLIVHQLLGYSAGFIRRLAAWAGGMNSVYYLHDFYPICPRVTMINAIKRFCGVADSDTCARCVEMDGAHEMSKLTELRPVEHRALFGQLLRGFRHVVAPSANAAGYVTQVFPELDVQAVPHPEVIASLPTGPRHGTDDEIMMFGAIGPHKGSHKLLEIAQRARLTHPHLRFRVIGHTNIDKALVAIGNVTVTGRYQPGELGRLIEQTQGRLAIFLPSWPETYSYTLSEAAAFGFIPLVPDIGAPAARVRDAGYGVVFPFPVDAEQVLGVLDDIRAGRIAVHEPGAGPARLIPTSADVARTRRLFSAESRLAKWHEVA